MTLSVILVTYFLRTYSEKTALTSVDKDLKSNAEDVTDYMRNDGFLHCIGRCVYIDEENVQAREVRRPNSDFIVTEISLRMQNNCIGEKCCAGSECTPYTSGSLTSLKKFGYGSYRFHVMASGPPPGFPPDRFVSWSCFGVCINCDYILQRGSMSISFCISTEDPSIVMTYLMHEEVDHRQLFRLHFNSAKTIVRYRLDWTPKSITWIVEGEKLTTIHAPHYSIPDQPLHIRIILTSPSISDGEVEPTESDEIEFLLRLYRIRYQKYIHEGGSHSELFVSSHFFSLSFVLIAISFWFAFCILWQNMNCHSRNTDYILFEQS